jgi:hypothetical protein
MTKTAARATTTLVGQGSSSHASMRAAARVLSVCLLLAKDFSFAGTARAGECIPSSIELHSFHCYSGTRAMHCLDVEERCPEWADDGECQANPGYMQFHCRKSCQTCLDGHIGVTQIAPESETRSAVADRLVSTARYLQSLSDDDENSHLLLGCNNNEPNCTYWAVRGDCSSNPAFMKEHCAAACQSCH